MDSLQLDTITLTWLNGGNTGMDGGAIFGVVPKPLWSKKYTYNEKNQVEIRTDPIFVLWNGKNFLIDAGIGKGKLTEKQLRNYGVTEESELEIELQTLGLVPEDIDYVLMTHMHFDHACGLTTLKGESYTSTFPHAKIITSAKEWNEMKNPNIRSKNTYWEQNWKAIEHQVETFEKEWTFGPFQLIHTGGHSDGHSILIIKDEKQICLHMGDILPTHAHQNVLWVTAYDDYPLDSISQKQKWIKWGVEQKVWFTFYHDAVYRALKWDVDGKIADSFLINSKMSK
ncbi:YtnP family quorum-quenching lactonase [Niallia sp. 01092]|uniref:YtnP family quorum-quenching lactonase n=1 Tax=unclassified Niallia TaxID=2837522 RepID=UPI003FD4F889